MEQLRCLTPVLVESKGRQRWPSGSPPTGGTHLSGEVDPQSSDLVGRLFQTLGVGPLARFPLGRNRPSEKNSRKINMLEHVLAEKVIQLFRNML